jgi:hypothetical protein
MNLNVFNSMSYNTQKYSKNVNIRVKGLKKNKKVFSGM